MSAAGVSRESQVVARRRWAYGLIRRSPVIPPSYGSDEWLMLPDGDSVKIAALVVAAEATAREADDLEADLRRQLDAARVAHKQAEDAEYAERAAAHRKSAPRFVESFVDRRKRQLATAALKTGDYPGRGDGA